MKAQVTAVLLVIGIGTLSIRAQGVQQAPSAPSAPMAPVQGAARLAEVGDIGLFAIGSARRIGTSPGNRTAADIDEVNFASQVQATVLMLNGRDDFNLSPTSQSDSSLSSARNADNPAGRS